MLVFVSATAVLVACLLEEGSVLLTLSSAACAKNQNGKEGGGGWGEKPHKVLVMPQPSTS